MVVTNLSKRYLDAPVAPRLRGGQGVRRLRTALAAVLIAGIAVPPALGSITEPRRGGADGALAAPEARVELALGSGRLIRVGRPAASVSIDDPAIATITPVSNHVFYAVGKSVGSTQFLAMNHAKEVISRQRIAVVPGTTAIRDTLRRLGTDSVQVSRAEGKAVISGSVDRLDDALNAVDAVRAGGAEQIDRVLLKGPRQVSLRVRFAEVSRSDLRRLGINWDVLAGNSTFAFGLVTGQPALVAPALAESFGSLSGSVNSGNVDASVVIDALQRDGLVQVLAEPTLTTVTGRPAEFLAGGEFPVPVPLGDDNVGIEYKRFGVSLAFTPTILPNDRIAVEVAPEVSFLSDSARVRIESVSVPGLSVRRARTTVELASGQSFAIAGLFQRDISEDIDAVPLLANIPVLGELFKSQRFQRRETELVILITPYLSDPQPEPKAGSRATEVPPSPRSLIGFVTE